MHAQRKESVAVLSCLYKLLQAAMHQASSCPSVVFPSSVCFPGFALGPKYVPD